MCDVFVFLRCGRRAEFQRVAQDTRQHRAFDGRWHFRHVFADHLPHDGCGASQRFDANVDGTFGFQATHQFVVVDDRCDIGVVDVVGQLGGIVGVNDHNRLVIRNTVDDAWLGQVPLFQHKSGFGVWFTQQHRLCGNPFDLV